MLEFIENIEKSSALVCVCVRIKASEGHYIIQPHRGGIALCKIAFVLLNHLCLHAHHVLIKSEKVYMLHSCWNVYNISTFSDLILWKYWRYSPYRLLHVCQLLFMSHKQSVHTNDAIRFI